MINKTLLVPELPDAFANLKDDIFKSMHCVKIGKIQSFDATKKTATIQVLFKRVFPDGSTASYPVLLDCPVFTLQGGGAYLEMPIAAGDQCIVIFSDRNIDAWYQNGAEAAPFDARAHDISDGIAIVGINALTSTLPSYSSTEARSVNGTGKVGIQTNKVTITNGATTLLTVIDGLIDVIKALTVATVPIDASGLAALETYKTTVAALLYSMIIRKVDSLNDWQFGKGTSDYARDEDAIAENVKTRLLSWVGDCFFALNEGVDWKSRLDVGQKDALTQELKSVILQSYGVVGVNDVIVDFSGTSRLFTITYDIITFFSQSFQSQLSQAVGA